MTIRTTTDDLTNALVDFYMEKVEVTRVALKDDIMTIFGADGQTTELKPEILEYHPTVAQRGVSWSDIYEMVIRVPEQTIIIEIKVDQVSITFNY